MINLLPYDNKRQTKAARMNFILFRYLIIILSAAIFLTIACVVAYISIGNNKSSTSSSTINKTDTNSTQDQANTINTNLATAKNILDRQTIYSNVITEIATVLPAGTILDSLSINEGSLGTTSDLKLFSSSSDNEKILSENIKKSSLLSNYKLISTTSSQNDSSKYPFTINVSLMINKGTSQ